MNSIVSCHSCTEYDVNQIIPLLEKIYEEAQGPNIAGKNILLKPNILFDEIPNKAVTTHPVFIESVIRFLQNNNAGKIFVGDAPAMHGATFKPRKSGIFEVCERTGAEWAFFGKETKSLQLPTEKVVVTKIIDEVDYIFSLPKLKTHELMSYTGAVKNTFGLMPNLNKAKQHAFHRSSQSMASFLLNLNETVLPDFIFMDAILAMEGPGPGNGFPFPLKLVLGSTNPLALDIIASKIIGYNPLEIETNSEGLRRKKWLNAISDIITKGEDVEKLIRTDFRLIRTISMWKMSFDIVMRRIPGLQRLERRPFFFKERCIGCKACVNICPVKTLKISEKNPKEVLINRKKCIHCFCCHEVCPKNSIEIKRMNFKIFWCNSKNNKIN